jgi:hypothetical protein
LEHASWANAITFALMVPITYFSRAGTLDFLWEICLGAVYLAGLILLALIVKTRTNDEYTARYFLPALLFKCFGLLVFSAMYYFVYGYGDTFVYFESASILAEIMGEDFIYGVKLLLGINDYVRAQDFLYNHFLVNYYRGADTFLVIKLTSFISIFGFNRFLPTSLLFALITFLCQWYLFKTLIQKYKKFSYNLALSILFIPSVAFWGSGVMKDSIILGSICLVVALLFRWIELGRRPGIIQLLALLSTIYVIYIIKFYVIISFFPALGFWLYYKFRQRIPNKALRLFIAPVGISTLSLIIVYTFVQFSAIDQRLQMDRMLAQADIYQRNHYSETGAEGTGSGYTLGDYDPTFTGILSKVVPAINVSLFRPYIWEIKSPAMVLAAMESLLFTVLFGRLLWYWRRRKVWTAITSDPFFMMSLVFVLSLAFIVGFTAFNFGALMRYKIPLMPFFFILLSMPVGFKARIRISNLRKKENMVGHMPIGQYY